MSRWTDIIAAASPAPWARGKIGSTVVTPDVDSRSNINGANGDDNVAYYGGGLIAESVGSVDVAFISEFDPATVALLVALFESIDPHEYRAAPFCNYCKGRLTDHRYDTHHTDDCLYAKILRAAGTYRTKEAASE